MSISKSRDYFLLKKRPELALNANESDVSRIPNRETPYRAWVGFDLEEHAVAYFETKQRIELSFAVSRVISVVATSVEVESSEESVYCIKVTCREPRLNEVFYAFVDELLERLVNEDNAASVIQRAAADWRRLLQLANTSLSRATAIGLFGELRFLESSIQKLGPGALENWQREDFDVQDFISTHARVEVKTSSFQNRSAVSVHGLKQLALPINSTLTLAVAEIDEHGSEYLDEVITRILSLGADRELLTNKLATIGYVIGMPESQDYSFDIVSWRFWEITSESPVLSSTSILPNIATALSSVNYTLQLGALGPAASVFDHTRLLTQVKRP